MYGTTISKSKEMMKLQQSLDPSSSSLLSASCFSNNHHTSNPKILSLPQELLTTSISSYLTLNEQYRFLASCSSWLPLLQRIRTFTFQHEVQLRRFMNEEIYHQEVLNLLGYQYDNNSFITSKIKKFHVEIDQFTSSMWTCKDVSEDNHVLLQAFLLQYGDNIATIPYLNFHQDSAIVKIIQSFSHLQQFISQSTYYCITLHVNMLYKLHRLRVNTFHQIENLSYLDDLVFYKEGHHRTDVISINTSLASLKGIASINIKQNNICELKLVYNANLQRITCLHCTELTDIGITTFLNTPQVELFQCPLITDISPLSKASIVEIVNCKNITNVSALASVKAVVLRNLPQLVEVHQLHNLHCVELIECSLIQDIHMLSNVKRLSIVKCIGIECNQLYPIPTANNQNWTFFDMSLSTQHISQYHRLQRLNLRHCLDIEDISMLGGITSLEVFACPSIRHFPQPTGNKTQYWKFSNVAISDLTNFTALRSLELERCMDMKSVSRLTNMDYICIVECEQVVDIQHLSNIKKVRISTKGNVTKISHLYNISSLEIASNTIEETNVEQVSNIEHLTFNRSVGKYFIADFDHIRMVTINSCKHMMDLNVLMNGHVKFMTIQRCQLADIHMLRQVEELRLLQCEGVESIEGLNNVYGHDVPEKLRTERSKWFYDNAKK